MLWTPRAELRHEEAGPCAQASSDDRSVGSGSARRAVASFMKRLERDSAAREEGFKQLQLRVLHERDGRRQSSQQTHLGNLEYLRQARYRQFRSAAESSTEASRRSILCAACCLHGNRSSDDCDTDADPVASSL